jgi:preprotein translocase subunit YajC
MQRRLNFGIIAGAFLTSSPFAGREPFFIHLRAIMSLGLISDAMAAGTAGGAPNGAAGAGGLFNIALLVLIFVAFYFLLLRPQSKRQKEHRKMVEALAKGDEVITNGGMLGRVTNVGEQFIKVEVADGVELKIQRSAVSALMPKGTVKSA